MVNDGSSDGTEAGLADYARRSDLPFGFRYFSREQAGGAASARNVGWRAASTTFIAFTDDDCRPSPAWLQELLEVGRLHPNAIVQGRVEPDPEDVQPGWTRSISVEGPSPHFETCNVMYRRSSLEACAGFDESFKRAVGEDTDLGWRVLETGATQLFAAQALVLHANLPADARSFLRRAGFVTDDLRAYKRHAGLRRLFMWRVFYRDTHLHLLAAGLGLRLALRFPLALVLALPYARKLLWRRRLHGGQTSVVPVLLLADVVEVAATVRAAVKHRLPVV